MLAFTTILGLCYWGISLILFPISFLSALALAGITDVLILSFMMVQAGISLILQVINEMIIKSLIGKLQKKSKEEGGSVYDHFKG